MGRGGISIQGPHPNSQVVAISWSGAVSKLDGCFCKLGGSVGVLIKRALLF